MKTFVQAAGVFLLVVITVLFMANSTSKSVSKMELENTLDTAVEHALTVAMTDNTYTINDTDELAADVMVELFATCNTKAEYTIKFNVIDTLNGIVDVQVTQKVKVAPLIGSEVVCRKTIILDSSSASAA